MPFYEPEADDPMELVGMVMPGEPGQLEAMAECIVEEYVRLGWDARRLMTLFVNPMFMATHRVYQQKGEAYVRELIDRMCAKWGVYISPVKQSAESNIAAACHSDPERSEGEESLALPATLPIIRRDSSSPVGGSSK